MSLHGDHEGGAAKRRRDRRLRMHWRHEQLTLQMALAAALHHSRDVGPVTYNALRSQKTARAEATNNAPRSQMSSVAGDPEMCSGARGLTGCTRSGRKRGTSGTPWNRLSTPCSSLRRLMFLCRRWETSWWTYVGFSMSSFSSRLLKCPRSRLHPVLLAGAVCASLSRWQNSWWKYRRSSPILLYSELWSRTSTFQFLVVEGNKSVFNVFS